MKLTVKTSVNERHNVHYYTKFDIESEKPEVEDHFGALTGTRIAEVLPVYPDLSTTNRYTPDGEHWYELWSAKELIDEEDETQYDYLYIAVPVEPESDPKTYYLPTAAYWDTAFADSDPVCVDRKEAERLYSDWYGEYGANYDDTTGFDDLWREADEDEIAEYGTYDS